MCVVISWWGHGGGEGDQMGWNEMISARFLKVEFINRGQSGGGKDR